MVLAAEHWKIVVLLDGFDKLLSIVEFGSAAFSFGSTSCLFFFGFISIILSRDVLGKIGRNSSYIEEKNDGALCT